MSRMDLIRLLQRLGHLDDVQWQDRRNPQRVVRVVSWDGKRVTYGADETASVREFLGWFQPMTKSATKDGLTES